MGVNEPVNSAEGLCIAVVHRLNDNDDSLIVVPDGLNLRDEEIKEAVEFQEQYFDFKIIRKV